MYHHILFFTFLLGASFSAAKVEIAIEGNSGWGEKLPTWRFTSKHWLFKLFFGSRPLTGYHLWSTIFILFLTHLVFVFLPFCWRIELQLLSFLFLFWVIADILWICLNPAFGLKNFKKETIKWYKETWWGIAPREYFFYFMIGISLYLLSLWF